MAAKPKKIQIICFQSLNAHSGGGMARMGFYLARKLQEKGLLHNLVVSSKGKYETDFPSVPVSPLSRYYLFALNKLNKFVKLPSYRFRLLQERLFDWFCARRLDASTTILFVTQPYLVRTFRKAKRMGMRIIFIPANAEENYICKLVTEENKKLGVSITDAYTYPPRQLYFNKAIQYVDTVIGSYPTVYKSYMQSDFKGQVLQIMGHLKPEFGPIQSTPVQKEPGIYVVGYLAHTVVLKGLQYLLEAWEQIVQLPGTENIQLQVAGAMDATLKQYILQRFGALPRVTYVGHVACLDKFFKHIDLFVVPSLTEGGPYTAVEAAYYSRPVIITDNCGSQELLERPPSGCLSVPIRDAQAIKEQILWAFEHQEEARQIGRNAKHNFETYDMQRFIQELADYLEDV